MKKFLVIITLMTTVSFGANAQALLKSIGDKAKQKVEKNIQKKIDNKVDQAIDGAVNRIFGIDNKSQDAQQSSAPQDTYNYAQDLLTEYGPGWEWEGDEDELPTLPGSSLKDIIGFMPEIPAAEVLITEKGWREFDKAVKIAEKSANAVNSKLMLQMSAYSQKSQTVSYKESDKLEALFEELMNIQEAEANLLIARQQSAVNSVLGALTGNAQSMENGSVDGALTSLDMKVRKNWPKSEEARKVNQLYNDKKSVKDQNATIDSFNLKTMKKWIETIKTYQEAEKASVMRLVAIEEELSSMSDADKSNPTWNRCMLVLTQLSSKVILYSGYPARTLSCPMVRYPSTGMDVQ